jgi:cell division septum initiation protein DivIVA
VAEKEFAVVLRGYSRLPVRLFLSELAVEITERDRHISRLEAQLARAQAELAAAEQIGRAGLLRHLGTETAAILEAADASAVRMRAEAEATADRVRDGLRTIGVGLGDVHQLMGELVALVQSLVDRSTAPPSPPSFDPRSAVPDFTGDHDVEILLPDGTGAPRFL